MLLFGVPVEAGLAVASDAPGGRHFGGGFRFRCGGYGAIRTASSVSPSPVQPAPSGLFP
jgi:hypothetical protein